jgi:hypothetical protein
MKTVWKPDGILMMGRIGRSFWYKAHAQIAISWTLRAEIKKNLPIDLHSWA